MSDLTTSCEPGKADTPRQCRTHRIAQASFVVFPEDSSRVFSCASPPTTNGFSGISGVDQRVASLRGGAAPENIERPLAFRRSLCGLEIQSRFENV